MTLGHRIIARTTCDDLQQNLPDYCTVSSSCHSAECSYDVPVLPVTVTATLSIEEACSETPGLSITISVEILGFEAFSFDPIFIDHTQTLPLGEVGMATYTLLKVDTGLRLKVLL